MEDYWSQSPDNMNQPLVVHDTEEAEIMAMQAELIRQHSQHIASVSSPRLNNSQISNTTFPVYNAHDIVAPTVHQQYTLNNSNSNHSNNNTNPFVFSQVQTNSTHNPTNSFVFPQAQTNFIYSNSNHNNDIIDTHDTNTNEDMPKQMLNLILEEITQIKKQLSNEQTKNENLENENKRLREEIRKRNRNIKQLQSKLQSTDPSYVISPRHTKSDPSLDNLDDTDDINHKHNNDINEVSGFGKCFGFGGNHSNKCGFF